MKDTIETERLILKIIRPQDVQAVFDTMNSQGTAEIISFMKWPMTMEQAQAWCEKSEKGFKSDTEYLFLAYDRQDNPTGCVGVHRRDGGVAEIGYWVAETAQGQGYASEMLKAAVDFGFDALQVPMIWATAALQNMKSQRVLEKGGFRRNGLKSLPTAKGTTIECHVYELKK